DVELDRDRDLEARLGRPNRVLQLAPETIGVRDDLDVYPTDFATTGARHAITSGRLFSSRWSPASSARRPGGTAPRPAADERSGRASSPAPWAAPSASAARPAVCSTA